MWERCMDTMERMDCRMKDNGMRGGGGQDEVGVVLREDDGLDPTGSLCGWSGVAVLWNGDCPAVRY